MRFAPLYITTGYTFLSSGLTIEKIANAVKKNNYYGAAIADVSVMYGIPSFIKAMEKNKKKFLAGMEINIDGDYLCLYAINEDGYRLLCKISSDIQDNKFDYHYLKDHHDGVIGILDTSRGVFKEKFVSLEEITTDFTFYLLNINKLTESFYLGINVTSKEENKYANKVRLFAKKYTYSTIAFPHILYDKKDDAITLDIVNAIKNKMKIEETSRSGQDYFMSLENYQKIYTLEELEKTCVLIDSSKFDYHIKRGELMKYPGVDDSKSYLHDLAFNKLKEYGLNDNQEYIERLEYELNIISSMGYSDYFLIVQDYVNWAKENNIVVGPGRGSGAGSLLSYLLNITTIDPLKYGLQFERFLNPGRKSMPDIDVDFMDIRRNDMVDYVREKYGSDKVSNIIAFQTIGAKQALRDIGHVYPLFETRKWLIDNLSNAITDPNLSLREAYKKLPAFKALVDSDKYYLQIVSLANKIEGLPRQATIHPSGVIFSEQPINGIFPTTLDTTNNLLSQYEMEYLEEQGFLKMDFLSLRNLTIIDRIIKMINHNHSTNINPMKIPFDVKETYETIASGQVMGIFQLESAGMRRAISLIKPSSLEDVTAIIALFRPGPMHEIETYAKRKHGKEKVSILHGLEEILAPTYGVITYQEQVNNIAKKMAGLSLSEADSFRRAISKKDSSLLNEQKVRFISGAIKNGYSKQEAEDIFANIAKFSGYGLNKSHAVVYATIASEMAYLKYQYPLEFYCGNLSYIVDAKFGDYVNEMNSRNYKLYLPDINESESTFIIKDDGILFPLNEIKSINSLVVSKILEERQNGPFTDFFNFLLRMQPHSLSKDIVETLIYAGCFDKLEPSRASLIASYNRGVQFAALNTTSDGQLIIDRSLIKYPSLIKIEDNPKERIEKEYEVLGIMISDNPLKYYESIIKEHNAISLSEASEHKESIVIAGLIRSIKVIKTKKGTPMAFIKIFDQSGEFEVTVFSDLYTEKMNFLSKNDLLIIKGRNDNKGNESSFIAREIEIIEV